MTPPLKGLKFSVDSFLALLFIVSCVIPYISHAGRGDVISYFIFLIWLTSVLVRKNQFYSILRILSFRKLELIFLLLFFFVAMFNYLFITPTSKAFQFTLMPITYFILLIMDAYYYTKDLRYKLSILFMTIVVLAIQAAISIPYIYGSGDMVSRMYTSGELEGAQLEEALRHGVGSANLYAFLCGVFYLGIGVLNKFNNKILKAILFISLSLILISIVSSSYSVSFTMLIIGAVIILIRANWAKLKVKYILAIVFIIGGLIGFYNFVLSDSQLIEPIQRKINLIKTGNLREDGRMDLAALSLHTFLNNPFFGIGVPDWGLERQVGEHMPWIDFPAHYGLFGFLPFLIFLFLIFKRNYKFYFKTPRGNLYSTSCLAGYAIFIFANFVDPSIFESSMIVTLLFFYTSMFNWGSKEFSTNNNY